MNSPDMRSCNRAPNTEHHREADGLLSQSPKALPSDNAPYRSSALRNCSGSTRAAVSQYWKTGDVRLLSAIIPGIIAPYVESGLQDRIKNSGDHLRLLEDLGIDSLTMIEIGILIEDILPVSIGNEELRHFQTLGGVRKFIEHRLLSSSAGKPAALLMTPLDPRVRARG